MDVLGENLILVGGDCQHTLAEDKVGCTSSCKFRVVYVQNGEWWWIYFVVSKKKIRAKEVGDEGGLPRTPTAAKITLDFVPCNN